MELTVERQNQIETEFFKARKDMNEQLPPLFARAFALRGKFYDGCVFHYGLEKSLGGLLRWCNDEDHTAPLNMLSQRMVMKIVLDEIMEKLNAAEASITTVSL